MVSLSVLSLDPQQWCGTWLLSRWTGSCLVIGRAALSASPLFCRILRQTQCSLIESSWKKKGQVAYLVCLCNPSSLWWFLSLSFIFSTPVVKSLLTSSFEGQQQQILSGTTSQSRPSNKRCSLGSTKQRKLSMVRKQSHATGQCTVHSVISLVLYCTYR